MSKRKTTEEFVEESRKIHGDRYDYSNVEYINTDTKVCIVCSVHGKFWQSPTKHLIGHGCPMCNPKKKISENEVIRRFINVHGNRYDYSKVKYKNMSNKVCIICQIHGEFWQDPHNHLKGCGCPICSKNIQDKKKRMTQDEWIKKANVIHNNKYDYSKVLYTGCYDKVLIVCSKHGEFWQEAHAHLRGHGCPKCNNSVLENKIQCFLDKNNILYKHQYFPDFLNDGVGHQSLDFYLPDYSVAIECQGMQHYRPVELFGGEKQFEKQIELDSKKKKLCEDNGIKVLYYSTYQHRTSDTISSFKKLLYEIKN